MLVGIIAGIGEKNSMACGDPKPDRTLEEVMRDCSQRLEFETFKLTISFDKTRKVLDKLIDAIEKRVEKLENEEI